jgi:hypothetical protein
MLGQEKAEPCEAVIPGTGLMRPKAGTTRLVSGGLCKNNSMQINALRSWDRSEANAALCGRSISAFDIFAFARCFPLSLFLLFLCPLSVVSCQWSMALPPVLRLLSSVYCPPTQVISGQWSLSPLSFAFSIPELGTFTG